MIFMARVPYNVARREASRAGSYKHSDDAIAYYFGRKQKTVKELAIHGASREEVAKKIEAFIHDNRWVFGFKILRQDLMRTGKNEVCVKVVYESVD
jgi:hypothetical protein